MKYCLSTYSYGGYLSQFGIDGVIRKTAELGFDGIEFAQDEWFDHASDEELRHIGEVARQAGFGTTEDVGDRKYNNGEVVNMPNGKSCVWPIVKPPFLRDYQQEISLLSALQE